MADANYGVLPQGIVIKRLDTIIDELHDDLSAGWGVNTRLNPKSFLNVQLTAYADKIAELWEFGEHIYHSMYPFSAEDISLDNAVQFGGISREEARPTRYPIHCEAVDGTLIPKGSLIKTHTNPAINFLASADTMVTRGAFNRVNIRVATVQTATIYTVALDGALYSYTGGANDTAADIIEGLLSAITLTNTDFNGILSPDSPDLLTLEAVNPQKSHALVLSSNLTTQSVTGIVNYQSETSGEVALPDNTITQIVTSVPGLISVVNILPYIAGRLRQNDAGLRKSYIDKIFARSNRMLESIKSAILQNVQGVRSVAGYQNDTNFTDTSGRPPHSIEMVVDGGAQDEIALQIWDKKTDGIQTHGNVNVTIPGDEGEDVTIQFNRPDYVYVWFRIVIQMSSVPPPNYVDAITNIICAEMATIEPGKPINPQQLIVGKIYGTVPGIGHIETLTFNTTDESATPGLGEYVTGTVPISPRQRAVTDETRIEVLLE